MDHQNGKIEMEKSKFHLLTKKINFSQNDGQPLASVLVSSNQPAQT